MRTNWWAVAVLMAFAGLAGAATAKPGQDVQTVAALDSAYQAAVKRNDAAAMAHILHPQMILVVGSGSVYTRDDLLKAARDAETSYEDQEEVPGTQTVRIWGDTAVVTAKLWLKGSQQGKAFDRHLWFSDTYVRTPAGWRYAFGQASLALSNEAVATPAAEGR